MRGACLVAAAAWSIPTALAQTRPAGEVRTGERVVAEDLEPAAERRVDYLSGGAMTAAKTGTGTAVAAPNAPAWLGHWLRQFREAAQPQQIARTPLNHPLTQREASVLTLVRQPGTEVLLPATLAWSELVCPTAAKPMLRLDIQAEPLWGFEDGRLDLGLELICRKSNQSVVRAVRLVAEVDVIGRVAKVYGVRLEGEQTTTAPPSSDARPTWPLEPADLSQKRPAWQLEQRLGWLVQLDWLPRVQWTNDGGLPQLEPFEAEESAELSRLPQRLLLLFGPQGAPTARLLFGGVPLPRSREVRQPLKRESADTLQLTDLPGLWISQRLARQGDEHGAKLANLQLWHLGDTGVQAWTAALPLLDLEGLWQCHPTLDQKRLRCSFLATGAAVEVQVPDLTLKPNFAAQRFAEDASE